MNLVQKFVVGFFFSVEWMKKRWSYLREQYVKQLKQMNNVEPDKPSKKNYKYFKEMSFLANHIQIRSNNHDLYTMFYKPDNVETNNRMEEDNGRDVQEHENVDFVITENEIEAYNDDDDDLADNLFVELSDGEQEDDNLQPNHSCNSELDAKNHSTTKTHIPSKQDIRHTSDTPRKPTKPMPLAFEDVQCLETELHMSTEDADGLNENCRKVTKTNEARCEDVIFGELVTSMLKKMDSPNRKRAKKEILNILLS